MQGDAASLPPIDVSMLQVARDRDLAKIVEALNDEDMVGDQLGVLGPTCALWGEVSTLQQRIGPAALASPPSPSPAEIHHPTVEGQPPAPPASRLEVPAAVVEAACAEALADVDELSQMTPIEFMGIVKSVSVGIRSRVS